MGHFEKERLLTESESVIMRAVWDYEEDLSVPDLIEAINERYGKDYARTTVVTFLLKLSEKGFARTYRRGKLSYVCKMVSKEDYRKILTQNLVNDWYGGDVQEMMKDARADK